MAQSGAGSPPGASPGIRETGQRGGGEPGALFRDEQFRLIIESALDYAIFTMNKGGVIESWSPGAQSVFGWTPEEAVGQGVAMTFTAEDCAAGVVEQELGGAARDGVAPDIRWHLRADGRRVFIEGFTRALHDENGVVRGFLKIGQDMTERRRIRQALKEGEERFRQFGEASSDILWIRDADTLDWEYLSPAFERVCGVAREAAMAGDMAEAWAELLHPDDREPAMRALRDVAEGRGVRSQYRIRRPDGALRWLVDVQFPMPDQQGAVTRIGGIIHDVTDERALADRLQVLVAELQHRTRNLIGVIRAIATRTAAASSSLQAFSHSFTQRLDAIGRVNGMVSRSWDGGVVDFEELLKAEFAAHGALDENGRGDQVTLEGPSGVRLRSASVQTFALAIHELATNAMKYGALASPKGRVAVSWSLAAGPDGASLLNLDWREQGVRIDPEQRDRRGYGRELIERALPYQLKAQTEYELTLDGVRCRIALPVVPAGDVPAEAAKPS